MKAIGQDMDWCLKEWLEIQKKCKLNIVDGLIWKADHQLSTTLPNSIMHSTCVYHRMSSDLSNDGDASNETVVMMPFSQSDSVHCKYLMLKRWTEVVLGDSSNMKNWLNWVLQLRFKHLRPRASQDEVGSKMVIHKAGLVSPTSVAKEVTKWIFEPNFRKYK